MRLFTVVCVVALMGLATLSSAQPAPCTEPVFISEEYSWVPICVEFCEEGDGMRTMCLGPVPSYCVDQYPVVGYLHFNAFSPNHCEPCGAQEAYLEQIGPGYWHVVDGLTYLCADYFAQSYTAPPFMMCLGWDPPLSNWGSPDCILPAELMSFNAVSVADGIEITFATASETDLNYFEIVREHNGNAQVAEQIDAENSATGSHYSYLDRNVSVGETYRYYLRTVDLDGSIEEHIDHAVTVTYSPSAALPMEFSLRAYPNPFNPTTSLTYSVVEDGTVELKVFDANGRTVATLVNEYATAGEHRVEFDASALASGAYFAQLRAGNLTQMTRIVLLK